MTNSFPHRLLTAALLCIAPTSLLGQVVETRLSVGAGNATDALGTRSSAVSISPSLVARGAHASFALGGDAVRFGAGGWAASGSTGLDLRAPLGAGLAFTLGAGGSATTTSFDARFLTAQAIPALEGRWGPVQLYGGARAAAGSSTLRQSPVPGGAPIGGSDVTTSRTMLGSVAGGGLVLGSVQRSGYVGVREERGVVRSARVADVQVVDRALAATFTAGSVVLTGSIGSRQAADERTSFGSASAAWTLHRAVTLQLAAGRYPSNRLTGTLGGNYLSAGMSLVARSTPGAPRAATQAIPGAPRVVPPGMTRLAIRAVGASRVEIAGDWNDWKPVAVHRASDGWWYADLALRPGRYRYGFKVDGTRWTVPDGADAVDDGFGGRSAWLVVK